MAASFVYWTAGQKSSLMLLANNTISWEGGSPKGCWSEKGTEICIKWFDNAEIFHAYKKIDNAMVWELQDVNFFVDMSRTLLIRTTDTVEYAGLVWD